MSNFLLLFILKEEEERRPASVQSVETLRFSFVIFQVNATGKEKGTCLNWKGFRRFFNASPDIRPTPLLWYPADCIAMY